MNKLRQQFYSFVDHIGIFIDRCGKKLSNRRGSRSELPGLRISKLGLKLSFYAAKAHGRDLDRRLAAIDPRLVAAVKNPAFQERLRVAVEQANAGQTQPRPKSSRHHG